MASIREYASVDGSRTFKVLFRHAGKQSSRSFADRKGAEIFIARGSLDGWDTAVGLLDPKPQTPLTLDDVARKWFTARELDVQAGSLTPRVLTGYRRDYANWISPYLGHKAPEQIDEMAVQAWVDKIKIAPRSAPKTVAARHAILHQIFKWASSPRRKIIAVGYNPCVGTELPERHRTPPKGLRLPELQALQEAARSMYPDAADLIDFIIGTGWRLGEAIALTAGQVEDDEAVYVSMSRVWRREVGFVEDAKSEAGLRRLRVLGDAVPVLRRRVKGLAPGDLVFTTERGLPWDEAAFRRDYWKKITVKAGLGGGWRCDCGAQPTSSKRVESHLRAHPDHQIVKVEGRNPTPHWLRHSHVFVCHAAGMDLAQIQRRLGHRDIKLTINTYGRLIDGMDDAVADRLEALLTNTKPNVVEGTVVTGTLG